MVFAVGCSAPASAHPGIPALDGGMAAITRSGNMGFKSIPGTLDISQFESRSLLSRPLEPSEDLEIIPAFGFKSTSLHFDQVPTSIFFDKHSLRTFDVYPFSLDCGLLTWSGPNSSPWIYGVWTGARLATDFRTVDREDFSFQFAAGAGYRIHEKCALGIGSGVTDSDGAIALHPGIGLDWSVTERLIIRVWGTDWRASYQADDHWRFSVGGESSHEFWNISDQGGKPLSINLKTYRIGLFTSRHLTGDLWLRAGAGITLGNAFKLFGSNDELLVDQKLDGGFFAQVGLTINAW